MALTKSQKRKIEEEELYRAKLKSITHGSQKYGIPAVLSFFIPGLGQMVKGQVGKGILILICAIIGYFLFVLPGVIIHIWQIVDAYNN